VTDEQSANSAYAPYHPQAGLRNVGLGAIWREELSDRWTGFVSASVGRLLGPAADSPLTRKLTGGGVQAGIAWRF
jgi:outer membrane scaffolding protein for murein synthesis (MipA/OmpV family)